jgi:hypothetical protein
LSGAGHRKLSFFSICKSEFVVQDISKNLPRKTIQDGGDFQDGNTKQDGVCTFLLDENMFCERSIRCNTNKIVLFGTP